MFNKTIVEINSALKNKTISSVELTQTFLDRIKESDLNAYITVTEEIALEQAKAADAKINNGDIGILTGIPIAHKDLFCTAGVKTSCGSKMLDNFISPYESTTTQKLQNAGVVMLGKANMDEFAMGSSNESSFYGPVSNPWNPDKIPGGSSGGSAAIVASSLAVCATGTDTGGSIRQPASMCGITGIKPSYGTISRYGMVAFASSFDQAGPMAKSAEDAAHMLNNMAGFDPKDSTSLNRDFGDFTANLNADLTGVKIGVPKEFFDDGLDPKIETIIQNALDEYKKMGAILVEVSLPNTALSIPTYYVLAPAECSSNLSRFDGVRFGHRTENPIDLEDLYKKSRGEGFGHEVKRRIMTGTYVLSAGYYDAYYLQAQKLRRIISNDFNKVFEEVDVIMGPVTPSITPDKNSFKDSVSMYLSDIYTLAINLAGLPGMSIPAGFADNMPVGLQLIGKHFSEANLLNYAHKFQQQTDWHTKQPQGRN